MGQAYYLRQIQGIISDGIKDKILKFVHHAKQFLTEGRHGEVELLFENSWIGGLLGLATKLPCSFAVSRFVAANF